MQLTWQYLISRFLLATLLAVAMVALGAPVWMALLVPPLSMMALLLLIRSGRYATRQESSLFPLRRDERGQHITQQAATYGFVVLMMLLAVAVLLYANFPESSLAQKLIPPDAMQLVLAAGFITWIVSEVVLRKRR